MFELYSLILNGVELASQFRSLAGCMRRCSETLAITITTALICETKLRGGASFEGSGKSSKLRGGGGGWVRLTRQGIREYDVFYHIIQYGLYILYSILYII